MEIVFSKMEIIFWSLENTGGGSPTLFPCSFCLFCLTRLSIVIPVRFELNLFIDGDL